MEDEDEKDQTSHGYKKSFYYFFFSLFVPKAFLSKSNEILRMDCRNRLQKIHEFCRRTFELENYFPGGIAHGWASLQAQCGALGKVRLL